MSPRFQTVRSLAMSGLLFGVGLFALLGSEQAVLAAPLIAVDYDGTAGDTPSTVPATQPGFTSVTTNVASLPGGYTTTITPGGGLASGFFTRSGVTNSGTFTEAALYQDFFYSQNNTNSGNSTATIKVTGLNASTPYKFTFYTYDASNTIQLGSPLTNPFTTSFTGTGNTTGSGTLASYIPGVNPPVNEAYTSTGIYTSTTGTFDFLAALTSNNDFLRINGFTVDAVAAATPEPASLILLGLGVLGSGLGLRRKKA